MIAAVLPAVLILIYVFVKDRTEREPAGLLISLVLLGFVATVFAVIAETIGEIIFSFIPFSSEDRENFWKYLLVVGLSEEFFKYICMRFRTWNNKNFNCSFDGVVYAVFVSLGFALLENILYVFNGGLSTAIIRAFTAIPGHAAFGVFMGVFYTVAKRFKMQGNLVAASAFETVAVAIPTLIHGIYDYSTTLQTIWLFIFFIIALFIVAFIMIRHMSKQDAILHDEGAEGVPNEDIPVIQVPNDGPTSSVGHVIIEPTKHDPTKKLTNYRTGSNK